MGLAELRPDAVLHVGIAGAPELEPLSVVIGSEAYYADIVDPSSLMPKVERAYPAPELVEAARRALPDAHVLPIASCARVGRRRRVPRRGDGGLLGAAGGRARRRARGRGADDLEQAGRVRPRPLADRGRARPARRDRPAAARGAELCVR